MVAHICSECEWEQITGQNTPHPIPCGPAKELVREALKTLDRHEEARQWPGRHHPRQQHKEQAALATMVARTSQHLPATDQPNAIAKAIKAGHSRAFGTGPSRTEVKA